MTVGDVAAGSFDSYEGIRIVIPGAIAVALASVAYETIVPHSHNPVSSSAGTTIVAALIAGLALYYVDVPGKSAAYSTLSPTSVLQKGYPHLSPLTVLNRYLILFNTRLPLTIRNRSLYMGSMYRIGVELILLSGATAYAVATAGAFNYGEAPAPHMGAIAWSSMAMLAALMLFGFYGDYRYERKSARRKAPADGTPAPGFREVLEAILQNFARRSMFVFLLAVLMLTLGLVCAGARRYLVPPGMVIAYLYWSIRYVLGDGPEVGARVALRAPSSGVLFALPLIICWAQTTQVQRSVLFTDERTALWALLSVGIVGLILSRGHERKLHGAYASQRTWFDLNPDECDAIMRSVETIAATSVQPEPTASDVTANGSDGAST
jgi:hypothetical protein